MAGVTDAPPSKAQDIFQDIMNGSRNAAIDPTSCIPLTRIRKVSDCGMKRLASIFDGDASSIGMSRGHSSSGAMPIVVKLSVTDKSKVIDYFIKDKNMSELTSLQKYDGKETWYGIIDGSHRQAALLYLMDCSPEKWGGYMWWVTVIQNTAIDRLQAFARDRNDKQRKECMVDFTLYDMLYNMKKVAMNFQILRGEHIDGSKPRKGLITEIADEYCGGLNAANSTSRQLAGVAIRLSNRVIEVIGKIMNTEHPIMARKFYEAKQNGSKRSRVDPYLLDTRVFRSLFNTSTLRSATIFKDTPNDDDRVHALVRCQYLAINEGLKSVNGKQLNEQVKNAIAARKEIEKMNDVVGSAEWPPELEILKQNLLETTKLDEQVQGNTGEDRVILPRLREVFEAHHGRRAEQRIHLFMCGRLNSGPGQNPEREETNESSSSSSLGGVVNEATENKRVEDNANKCTELSPSESRENEPCESNPHIGNSRFVSDQPNSGSAVENCSSNLQKVGVSVFQMSWEAYEDTIVQSRENIEVDMILTDPPFCLPNSRVPTGEGFNDHIDEKEMELFSQFSRRVLVPGGYVFIFTSYHLFSKWKRAFDDQEFVVSKAPFVICKRTGMIQNSSSTRHPQNGCEFGLVARKKGVHPRGFLPRFSDPYRLIKCSHSRRFLIIDSVPPVRRKLKYPGTNRPVRIEEKNTMLLSEIMNTYCPGDGTVLDAYGGTLTTALACVATGRNCIAIEKSAECFNIAEKRLQQITAERLKRQCTQASSDGRDPQISAVEILQSMFLRGHGLETDNENDSDNASELDDCVESESDNGNNEVETGTGSQMTAVSLDI